MDAAVASGDTSDIVVTLDDIERLGCSNMDENGITYYNYGADQGQTLEENRKAFLRLRLRPRVLRNVGQREMTVTLLGDQTLSMPVGISPTAEQKLAHPDGEVATAKAAQAEKTLMILSTYSTVSIEAVKRAAPGALLWFNVPVFKDRDLTKNFVRRAEEAGYRAIVLTVDMPLYGNKVARAKKDYCYPDGISSANFEGTSKHEYSSPNSVVYQKKELIDPSGDWDYVTWLMSVTNLPVVVKGITTAEDAEEAVSRGVSAILVSNHGGRQLDGLAATIEILPEIVSAVRGRVEVYLDGGVRHGTDVIKALALGAKAVFVGRPVLWGLAYNGEDGVRQMLGILRQEIDRTLALMGCSSVDMLRPEMVVHQSHYRKATRYESCRE